MSDRGPADEEDGDTANSSPDPTHTLSPTHARICLKTNNISHSHRQTQRVNVTGATTFPLENGHGAQTNLPQMSPSQKQHHTHTHRKKEPIRVIYI